MSTDFQAFERHAASVAFIFLREEIEQKRRNGRTEEKGGQLEAAWMDLDGTTKIGTEKIINNCLTTSAPKKTTTKEEKKKDIGNIEHEMGCVCVCGMIYF